MSADVKLQIVTIGASGLVVLMIAPLLLAALPFLNSAMVRLLLIIPPVSVAAYIFVFNFLRAAGGAAASGAELPSLGVSLAAIAQAAVAAGIFMGLFSAGMLLFVRWAARWI